MKNYFFLLTVIAALFSPLANAQRESAADSTFIYHTAQKIMPDIPAGGGNTGSNPALQPPNSVNELIRRWHGLTIDWDWFDGTGTYTLAAQVPYPGTQMHILTVGGHAGCIPLDDLNRSSCNGGGGVTIDITQAGIYWRLTGCVLPAYGDLRGDGQYLWTDYLDDGGVPTGLEGLNKWVRLKRLNVSGSCRVDGAG